MNGRDNETRITVDLSRERTELATERTRLANKRTFLAWVRTALTFMTFGFLLEKVDAFLGSTHLTVQAMREIGTLGLSSFIIGPLMVLVAGWQYYRVEKRLGFESFLHYLLPEFVVFIAVAGGALYMAFTH